MLNPWYKSFLKDVESKTEKYNESHLCMSYFSMIPLIYHEILDFSYLFPALNV